MSTNNHERISGISANGKPWQYADGMETVNCIANSNTPTTNTPIMNNTLPGISKPGSAETASAASNTSFSANNNNNNNNPFSTTVEELSAVSHQESASAVSGSSGGHDPRSGGVGTAAESGESSPGHSTHSTSNCSRTARSDESLRPRRSGSRECGDIQWIYNTPPELDQETDHEDDLEHYMCLQSEGAKVSIAIQTDQNDEYPSYSVIQQGIDNNLIAPMPMFFNMSEQQHLHQSSMVPPTSTPLSDLTATCSNASDGTLQLVIQNFRHMADTVRGPSKFVQSVPWRIMVMPRQHVVQKKGTQKCLGFFLQCCPDAYSESWSCQATAELRLISQKPGVPNFTRKTNHVYTAKENDWGYSCFMTWADILDEAQGYIKEDKVVLEVSVKADPPKNILSLQEFTKKIQDYKRLADMQCQRGFIDKAIEVNTQALKFCKDKNDKCKLELEAQKTYLIEMKLKQSIERIEKGNDSTKFCEDDPAANQSALRHALGTTAARAANSTKNNVTQQQQQQPQLQPTNKSSLQNRSVSSKDVSSNDVAKLSSTSAVTTPTTTPPINVCSETANFGGDPNVPPPPPKDNSSFLEDDMDMQNNVATQQLHGMIKSTMCSAGEHCRGHLSNKTLVSLGQFNEALLNSDNFEYIKDKYPEEENLLPDQIHTYLQHLSEKDKGTARLKRFSNELEMLTSSLDPRNPLFGELAGLENNESVMTMSDIEQAFHEQHYNALMGEKNIYRQINYKNLCGSCKKGDFKSTYSTKCFADSQVQTDFESVLIRDNVDSASRLMQLHAHQHHLQQQELENQRQQLQQQLQHQQERVQYQQHLQAIQQQQNEDLINNIPPPALPARQRKKATAKKSIQQLQQQQQLLQQQQQQQPIMQQQHLLSQQQQQKPQLQTHLQQPLAQQLLLQQQQQQPQIPEHNARLDELEARIKELEERERKTKSSLDAAKSNEAILTKQFYDSQKNLQQANEKLEKLNLQLKDRKLEIKKLEKKAKSEAQLSTENSELHDKIDALKKENSTLQKQIVEEQAKYKRDTQSLADSKKHLHLELNTRATEIQKLNNQLEEKTQALKKSEKERKCNATTVSNLSERLKKAEISLLEHKLEDGLKILERARDDCVMQIRTLEEMQKRYCSPAELEIMKKNITEWENKREEVVVLINQAKTEFSGHIAAIKSGKQYSQLPKIQVAKPPPCPKLHPMPQPIPPPPPPSIVATATTTTAAAAITQPPQATRISPALQQQQQRVPPSPLPLDRKVITPPNSSRTRVGGGATTPQQLLHNPILPSNNNNNTHMNGNYVVCSATTSMSNNSTTPNKAMAAAMNLNHQQQTMPPQLHSSMPATTTIAPIGVRPPNFQNGGMVSKTAIGNSSAGLSQMHPQQRQSPSMLSQNHYHPSMMQSQHPSVNSFIPSQQQQQQHHHQQQQQYLQQQQQSAAAAAALKSTMHNNNTSSSSYNQWSGWGDQVNNIEDLLNPRRSFGPLGSNFGDTTSAAPGSQRNNLGNNLGGPVNENHGAFFP